MPIFTREDTSPALAKLLADGEALPFVTVPFPALLVELLPTPVPVGTLDCTGAEVVDTPATEDPVELAHEVVQLEDGEQPN